MLKQPKQRINPLRVAPMMGLTTRHYRYFFRLISKKIQLYTEMLTTAAILNSSNRDRLLAYHASEQPLAIQLGGGIPNDLAKVAKIVADYGYSEINLNIGCPSDRVQSGCFGAMLFKDINRVTECVSAMSSVVKQPITIKTRIGVDDYESYDYLAHFIDKTSQAGCQLFIIHARKAWLQGLSPKKNRDIPPLNYPWVYQIKRDFPHLMIVLNGGIKDLTAAREHLNDVDGVMIGRAAWSNPYLFREIEAIPVDETSMLDRRAIVQHYIPYAEAAFGQGENLSRLLQPLFNLFHGMAGGKHWRYRLTEVIQRDEAPRVALQKILAEIARFCDS